MDALDDAEEPGD